MPNPNEHACRLCEPMANAETARKNGEREHDGKKYDVIYQKQEDGKWEEQAYRYPKETWKEDAAKSHCEAHDGILFEPASGKDDGEAGKSGDEMPMPEMDEGHEHFMGRCMMDDEARRAECQARWEEMHGDGGKNGKSMNKQFQAVGKVSDVDRGTRTMVVRISSDCVDRQGEVMLPKGCRMDNYRKNPVVLWSHDAAGMAPGRNVIAKALWVKTDKGGILAKPQFAPHEDAQRVFDLYADGYLNTWSIGFMPVEGKGRKPTEKDLKERPDWAGANWIHDEWELLEFSAVAVPANPDALTLARSKGLTLPAPLDKTPVEPATKEAETVTTSADTTVTVTVSAKPVVKAASPAKEAEKVEPEDPMPKSLGRVVARPPEVKALGKAGEVTAHPEVKRVGSAQESRARLETEAKRHDVKSVGSVAEIERAVRARLRGRVMIYD